MANAKTPYWLVIKYYWWRLTLVSLIWFIYDVSRPPSPTPLPSFITSSRVLFSSRCTRPESTRRR